MTEDRKRRVTVSELETVSGGTPGEYRYIDTYTCPICNALNYVKRYCYFGDTTFICQRCNKEFTIKF